MLDKLDVGFFIFGDVRGKLGVAEAHRNIPFDIKRVYYMFDLAPDTIRGRHAHRRLDQVITCVQGTSCVLLDDGHSKKEVRLNNPGEGVRLPPMVWHEIYDFSPGTVFICLASDHFDPDDYIHDYEEFLSISRSTT